jgi:hypothetical protein
MRKGDPVRDAHGNQIRQDRKARSHQLARSLLPPPVAIDQLQ